MSKLLKTYAEAYYKGKPLIDDATYDYLEAQYGRDDIGAQGGDIKHWKPLYSLEKVYVGEDLKLQDYKLVETPKLDGLAISLLYDKGILVQAATRGDGTLGKDVLWKVRLIESIPNQIEVLVKVQITGEIVCPKEIGNARNFAAGAMNLKSEEEFASRVDNLNFVAYGTTHIGNFTYMEDMYGLMDYGFSNVVYTPFLEDLYRTDGKVFRVDNNLAFDELGYTAKHPKGAFALKDKADVAVEEAELLRVEWQIGSSGRITPVAHFTEAIIDDAKITKATLHNVSFVEDWDLDIGDIILVTRQGGVIPGIIGKK